MKYYYFAIENGRVKEISNTTTSEDLDIREADIVVRAEDYQEALCLINLKHIEKNY